MSNHTPTPRTVILAAIDASPAGPIVAAAGAYFAQLPNAELHLVHVVEVPNAKHLTAQLEEGRNVLERASQGFAVPPTLHIAAGAPQTEILQVAANLGADLLVLGTQELSSIERLLLGSVVEVVARRACCPVYIVRRKDYDHKAVPEIEKPCPDCVARQNETHGTELWCTRHSQRHVHGRLHYELPQTFAVGSMNVRPDA